MDRTQSSSKSIFIKWESLFNAGSFLVVGATFTGTHLISWLKPPISKEGVLLTSLLNGSAVLLADKIAEKGGIKETYYKTALTLFFVAVSTFTAPYVTLTLFAKTVTEVSFHAVYQIALSNLFIKAITYASYKLYESRSSPIPTTSEEIKKLSPREFTRISSLLKKTDYKEWNSLDLATQIAWNKQWIANIQTPLLFTKLTLPIEFDYNDLSLIKWIHQYDNSPIFTSFLDHVNKMIFSPTLDAEKIKNIQLNKTDPKMGEIQDLQFLGFSNSWSIKMGNIQDLQSLEKLDSILSWTITNSDISTIVKPGEFLKGVTTINNENIIKTITHVIGNRLHHAINYSLNDEQKPYSFCTISSKIEISVVNLIEKGGGCVITIAETVQPKNGPSASASALITFENKDSLEQLSGTIKFYG